MGRMANKTHTATIHTNHGDIVVELFGNHAPKTVKNFVGLATGELTWAEGRAKGGGVSASGERSDLSEILPVPIAKRVAAGESSGRSTTTEEN